MKNYRSNFFLLFFVVSALLLIGCAKSDSTTNRAPASTAPAASPAATTATSTTASNTSDIGVAECDTFLKAYETCVHDKVPAAARPTFETGMANWRKAWSQQAKNPQTKAALAGACKTAHEQAKASVKLYGCTL